MSEEIAISPTSRGWNVLLSVEGEGVSGLAIVDQKVRVGTAGLKMAGIAGVWTDDKHRKKGYASRVMWAAIDEMERRRYDISILFGIPDFYHRYGYTVCFTSPVAQVRTGAILVSKPSNPRVRSARAEDFRRIVDLYSRSNIDRLASTIRSPGWQPGHKPREMRTGWRMPRMGADVARRPGRAFVVEGEHGRIIAYAAYDAQVGHCCVIEVGGTDRAAYPAIANKVRQLAKRAGADQVRFCGPVDDPFGEYLGRFGCGWSVNFPANSGSMGRVITLQSTVNRLLPVLDQRLEASEVSLPGGGLTIVTDIGAVTIQSRKGLRLAEQRSSVRCSCSQMTLTQLLFGYRSAEDLSIEGDLRVAKKWMPLLTCLFPRSNPYMWWADRF